MLIGCLTDTHWTSRKSSKHFQDYFELFYKNIFFPKLEELGIDTVIHLGDAFDTRKSIDFGGLEWTQRVVLEPLRKYDVHLITGNHDCSLRNTNRINSPDLLLKEYSNIKVYSEPIEVIIDKLPILFLPWINSENEKESMDLIQKTKADIAMGHLELNGFMAHKGHTMVDGREPAIFNKFKKVFSGHYHTRSDNGTIFYLGNTYEMFFNDVGDTRGFTIFDTDTLEHYHVNNPYSMFHHLYYDDTPYQIINFSKYSGKIVKVIVRKKSNVKQFEKYIEKLYEANVYELKIVENFLIDESENFEAFESENTMDILNRYIEESDIDLDKSKIQNLMNLVYQEACELV
jgi:hypothetical protein